MRMVPKFGVIVESREKIEEFFVVELDKADTDEGLDGIADPQVVEDVVDGAGNDSQLFLLLKTSTQIILLHQASGS